MNKKMICGLALGIGIITGITETAPGGVNPGTGIYDTAHDFSSQNTRPEMGKYATDPYDRICIYCHTPHNSIKVGSEADDDGFGGAKGVTYLPLWNHVITDYGHTTDYDLYNAGETAPKTGDHALQAELVGEYGQPQSVSRLCLSCHDGSVAVNAYGYNAGSEDSRGKGDAFIAAGSPYLIGFEGDLSNHHPVGFDYVKVANGDTEIADADDPAYTFKAKNGNLTIRSVLSGDIMTCASCHDVHNSNNTGQKLVWQDNVRSAFCCVCHIKCSK